MVLASPFMALPGSLQEKGETIRAHLPFAPRSLQRIDIFLAKTILSASA
jgi:hypothetical protein